jgi:Papain-like cysteine protease AvrRpt2
MSVQDVVVASSRPYSSLKWDISLWGSLVTSRQLAFTMQAQTQSNWCWAATSTSVSHFYWFLSPWTQCSVASAELNRTDCCNASVPSACNVPWYLDRALTRTNNFVSITGPASFSAVCAEIDAGRPVGARIGWSGGGGHFVCIYGYSTFISQQYFDIDDPIYGKSHLSVADFSTNYQGSGTWTHTYFTKRYFRLPIIPILVTDPILHRIYEARPLLKLKQQPDPQRTLGAGEAAEDAGATIGLAHRVYTVGLDAIAAGEDVTGTPSGLRVYETVDGVPQAFFDVDEGPEGRVRQMSGAAVHLEPFARALDGVVQQAEEGERDCELRLYKVPALNFEALWLSYEGGEGDQLVPLTGVGPLPAGVPVPFDEAVYALRQAAQPLADMDDTMGA